MLASGLSCHTCFAVDAPPFNIRLIAEANPFPPRSGSNFSYADVWSEGGYAYLGSDRGFHGVNGQISNGPQGVSIFSINNAGVPTFIEPDPLVPPPAGFQATTYYGNEMEDVEVWNGIGYFASDVNGSTGRTGVDIVNLAIPALPAMFYDEDLNKYSRVDASTCNANGCAHGKVHTLSIQRFNEGTDDEQRFLYTSDNETDIVKIVDVTDPLNAQVVKSLNISTTHPPLPHSQLPSSVVSHEVVVRNNRLYVASKQGSQSTNGWFHIYDVANPANPVLLKAFHSGGATHTAMPTPDGKTLIVAEERPDGNILIYDISMIDTTNSYDPDDPVRLTWFDRSDVRPPGAPAGLDAHSPHHIHIHGNLMFLPWYESGLQVFNISNPANPVLVGSFDTYPGTSTNYNGNWGVDLSMGLNRVLLSDRKRGLLVVDASGVVAQGDYNMDMVVDDEDYDVWRANYGSTSSGTHDAPFADANFNRITDAVDYVLWRINAGNSGSGTANNGVVPEPSTLLLLAVGIGAAGIGRRRGRSIR